MVAKDKEQTPKRRSRMGMGRYAYGYFMNPWRIRLMHFIRAAIGIIICVIVAYLLLSGIVNQRLVVESLAEKSLEAGHDIEDFLNSLMTDDSPLNIGPDGVYFKDADIPQDNPLEDVLNLEGNDYLHQWEREREQLNEDEENTEMEKDHEE